MKILWGLIVAAFCANIYIYSLVSYEKYFGETAVRNKVKEIYGEIVIASGLSNDVVPLFIVESNENNAYTDGTKIVIYTGLIENSSWDGIALTLGHELAHHHLMHTRSDIFNDSREQAEAIADKLGAFYMMKAGYDICEARKEWKDFLNTEGDFVDGTHPNYSYRYEALNINCGD